MIRSPNIFRGTNSIHFAANAHNYLVIPVIPEAATEARKDSPMA